jgi:hypothetical protein
MPDVSTTSRRWRVILKEPAEATAQAARRRKVFEILTDWPGLQIVAEATLRPGRVALVIEFQRPMSLDAAVVALAHATGAIRASIQPEDGE